MEIQHSIYGRRFGISTGQPGSASLILDGAVVGGGISSISINPASYGLSTTATGLVNRTAIQTAVNAASALGGGIVDIPPGSFTVNIAAPIILPSNITLRGYGATLVPDMTTITTPAGFPYAGGAVITTGVPSTGFRAGQTSGQTVNSSTVVSNIVIEGLAIDNSSYAGSAIAVGQQLIGIAIFFAHTVTIIRCRVFSMPNDGIYIFGCRHAKVNFNHVERCGRLTSAAATLNGISMRGWMDTAIANSSCDYECIGNTSSYNLNEGIEFDTIQGIVISGNILVGNNDYGIEGLSASPANSNTSSTYGYEVPADCIITGNYINGYDEVHNVYGDGGINAHSANQGRINISGNTIRNIDNSGGTSPDYFGHTFSYTSGSAINVGQTNNGIVHISGNMCDNITPGSTGGIIAVQAQSFHVTGNTANNCASTSLFFNLLPSAAADIIIHDNHVINGAIKRFAFLTIDAGAGNTAVSNNIVFTSNSTMGTTNDAVVISFPHNATATEVNISENTFIGTNSGAAAGNGFVRLVGANTFTIGITQFDCANNKVTFAGATANPIMFDATVSSGSITTANIGPNRFGNTTSNAVVNASSVISNLYQFNNGFPGQRITYASSAPTTGTWGIGDIVYNSVPSSGVPAFWTCSSGTTPVWVHTNFA